MIPNLNSREKDVTVILIMERKMIDQLLKITVPLLRFNMLRLRSRSRLLRLITRKVSVGLKLVADTRNNLRS